MTVELVILTPLLALYILLAVAFGRYEVTRQHVMAATRAAAEAAAVAASASGAQADASSAALPVLQFDHTCTEPTVSVDTSTFVPGGLVHVTVSCHVSLADLLIPGFPGTVDVQVVQAAPIDVYRSVQT